MEKMFSYNRENESIKKEKIKESSPKSGAKKFLKTLVIGAMISMSSMGEKIASAENLDGMDWDQGTVELKKEVKNNKNEVSSSYVVLKGKKDGSWTSYAAGTEMLADGSFSNEVAGQLEEKNVEKICIAHTHPNLPEELKVDGERGTDFSDAKDFSLPPSIQDVYSSMVCFRGAEQSASVENTVVEYAVFDPQGTWYYRPAEEGDLERSSLGEDFSKNETRIEDFIEKIDAFFIFMSEKTQEELFKKIVERDPFVAKLDEINRARMSLDELRESRLSEIRRAILGGSSQIVDLNTKSKSQWEEEMELGIELIDIIAGSSSGIDKETTNAYKEVLKKTQEDSEEFFDVYNQYVQDSQTRKINEEDLAKLEKAYLKIGEIIRFVPDKKLSQEAPCEGANLVYNLKK